MSSGTKKRKKARRRAREATEPATTPIAPRQVSDTALAAARMSAQGRRTVVFSLPTRPPQVAKDAPLLSEDSQITLSNGWANAALSSVWDEGLTFLGYPYLAELAQRPEYRMISETLATEATREWIEFTTEGKAAEEQDPAQQTEVLPSVARERQAADTEARAQKIKTIEEEFDRLKVQSVCRDVLTQDGYFGRGHVYVDTGDTDDPEELLSSIGDGWGPASVLKLRGRHIAALRCVEAVWCYPTEYNSNDPLRSDWFCPSVWYVQSKRVHRTRLLTVISRPVPDLLKPTYSFGGLALSQMCKPYVDNWLTTRQSVNDIISAFSVFVLSTNMQASLQGNGQDVLNRAELFNTVRDNRGLMMLDKETEEFQNVAAPLSGLELLQAQSQEHMASVSHIPTVKLLGIQPAGLNADSEGIMRSFYDWIRAGPQEGVLRPLIHTILGMVMIAKFGAVDRSIGFKFRPLWALDEKSEAEVQKIRADTDAVNIDSGIIDPAEARRRIADDPNSGYDDINPDELPEPPEPSLEEMLGGGEDAPSPDDESRQEQSEQVGREELRRAVGADSMVARHVPRLQLVHDEFRESEHPRDEDGKFGSGGGGDKKRQTYAAPSKKTSVVDGQLRAVGGGALPEHISRLKVPPGWSEVRYSESPDAGLLVTGRDAKGRRTAIYSDEHAMRAAAAKFSKISELERKYSALMEQNRQAPEEHREAADCLALIAATGVRPGSDADTGAEKRAFGATTLRGEHVVAEGDQTFLRFTGKKGVDLDLRVEDDDIAAMLRERAGRAGKSGRLFDVSDAALREYVGTLGGGGFRPKDFRTRLGTATAREVMASVPAPRDEKSYRRAVMDVARKVSTRLGNTPTVALAAYIDPTVFSRWRTA